MPKNLKSISQVDDCVINHEEFEQARKNIKLLLKKRASEAVREAKTNKKKVRNSVQCAKELYVFNKLIEICTSVTHENHILRNIVESFHTHDDEMIFGKVKDPTKFN